MTNIGTTCDGYPVRHLSCWYRYLFYINDSVTDPDPSDPYVFGSPGSGSGSLFHQAKIVRKTLIPAVLLLLFDFLSLKIHVNVPSISKT
jgi:hypothetical protein